MIITVTNSSKSNSILVCSPITNDSPTTHPRVHNVKVSKTVHGYCSTLTAQLGPVVVESKTAVVFDGCVYPVRPMHVQQGSNLVISLAKETWILCPCRTPSVRRAVCSMLLTCWNTFSGVLHYCSCTCMTSSIYCCVSQCCPIYKGYCNPYHGTTPSNRSVPECNFSHNVYFGAYIL